VSFVSRQVGLSGIYSSHRLIINTAKSNTTRLFHDKVI
jgi:hypothetical protein